MDVVDLTSLTDYESFIINGLHRSELDFRDTQGDSVVPLTLGYPTTKMVDDVSRIMQIACETRLAEERQSGNHMFNYGGRMGDPLLRVELVKFLSRHYGYDVASKDLLITSGASFALYHLGAKFFEAGDIVFAEEPTYFVAIDIIEKDIRMRVVHVSIDEDGIIPDELEKRIQKFYPKDGFVPSKQKLFWAMLFVIPCFQNPSSRCLSEERCKKVVHLARKYHLLVVSDDLYGPLRWGYSKNDNKLGLAPKRLRFYDNEGDPDYFGNVVSNCSFSKFMAPGLRVGWIEGPPVILAKIGTSSLIESAGGFNQFTSGLIGKALELGLVDEHLKEVCNEYKERVETIQKILDKNLQGIIKYKVPQGGFFMWIELPETMHCSKLEELCKRKYGVLFHCGHRFTKIEGHLTNFIRISFSYCERERLFNGVKNLAAAVLELHLESKKG